jgi:hypothetical protein
LIKVKGLSLNPLHGVERGYKPEELEELPELANPLHGVESRMVGGRRHEDTAVLPHIQPPGIRYMELKEPTPFAQRSWYHDESVTWS